MGFMEQSQVLEVMEMQAEMIRLPTKYLHILIQSTEQCLASSKLLTPHPLSIQRVCPPHRVHRVANAAFWRTFSHEGKISPGW